MRRKVFLRVPFAAKWAGIIRRAINLPTFKLSGAASILNAVFRTLASILHKVANFYRIQRNYHYRHGLPARSRERLLYGALTRYVMQLTPLLVIVSFGVFTIYHSYIQAAVDPNEHEYWISVGPINGSTAANYVYASFFNPAGSGKTAVVKRVRFNSDAVNTATPQDLNIRRITASSVGTQISNGDIPKKNTSSNNSILDIRHTGPLVTFEGTVDSRLMAVVGAQAAGSAIGGKDYTFLSEQLVLQPGEGIALYQPTAGSANQRIRAAIEWEEVASAPASAGEYMLAYPRIENAAAVDYKYHTFYNPAGSGKTAVVSRLNLDVDCDAAAVYTNIIYIRRISAASAGTQIASANIPKKHSGSANSIIEARHTNVTAALSGTADSVIAEVTPCGVANQPHAHRELTFGGTSENLIIQPGEGITLLSSAVGDIDQLVRLSVVWGEVNSTPGSAGEYIASVGPVTGEAATVGYNYISFFNPVGSGKTAIVKRVNIRADAIAAATGIPLTLQRTSAASSGTLIASADLPKKHSGSANSIMQVRHTNVTATKVGGANARLLSTNTPSAVGQLRGHTVRDFGADEPLILQPGEGIVLFQEAASSINLRIKMLMEWDEEVIAPSSQGQYMLNAGPINGVTTSGYNYISYFNPSGSGKTAIFKRIAVKIDANGAAVYVPMTLQRISAASAGTLITATDIPKKHTATSNSIAEVRHTNVSATKVGGNEARLNSVTTPGAAGTATAQHVSGVSEYDFENVEPLVLQPGEGIVLFQEAAGNANFRVRLQLEWDEVTNAPAPQNEYVISTGPISGSTVNNYTYASLLNPLASGKDFVVKRIEIRADRTGASVSPNYIPATVRRILSSAGGNLTAANDVPKKHSGSASSASEIRHTGPTVSFSQSNTSRLMGVTVPGSVGQDSGLNEASIIHLDELILKPGEGIALNQEGSAGDTLVQYRLRIVWKEQPVLQPTYSQSAYRWHENNTSFSQSEPLNKLVDPSALPPDTGRGTDWSPDGMYMTVAHQSSPFITIYKRSGDTFTKLADPATLPTGTAYDVAWSPDGMYMTVAHEFLPYVTIYKRSGDTFTKLADPATLPTGTGQGTGWSPDGMYMTVAHINSPRITIYKRSGDTFTKLADPAILPALGAYDSSWSPDGSYLSVPHQSSPFITIYKRSGDTFTKLADPAILPPGLATSAAWSPDGTYMTVTHEVSPFITIYKRSGDTFTKLADPATLPTGTGQGNTWSPSGVYLTVAHSSSPFITIYKRSGDTFTKLADPAILPTGFGLDASWSYDGNYMSVAHGSTPFITLYDISSILNVGAALSTQDTASTAPSTGIAFRLRLNLHFNYGLTTGHTNFKIQYAERSGICDPSFIGEAYADVIAGTGAIRFYDNSPTKDGTFAAEDANIPVHDGHNTVAQTYEENSTFTTVKSVSASEDGMWDFSLVSDTAAAGKNYCFRVLKSDGTALSLYDIIPDIYVPASSNTAPNTPSAASLVQKTTGDATITIGQWVSASAIKFSATASDPDNSGTLQLCVENDNLATTFSNTEDLCGAAIAFSGTPVVVEVTISGIPDANEYHWQGRIKDGGGLYSSWVSYGANAESARDYGLDTTAPTGGIVYDGTNIGVDATLSTTSLSSLSANWSGVNANVSGLSMYEYSIGTSAGGTNVRTWTTNGTGTTVTATGLTLQTSLKYFINIRTTDNAGNISGVISTDGQIVAPSVSFSVAPATINFASLKPSNSFTDTKTTTLTTSTNAYGGYIVRSFVTDLMRSANNATVPAFNGGTYSLPDSWQTGDTGLGYTSSDSLVQGVNKFQASTCPGGSAIIAPGCYAPFANSGIGDIVADNTQNISGSPITNEQFILTYRVTVPSTQAGTTYSTNVVYSITPIY